MEALNTLVTESLARHGFDRPLDYRRLQWSRWFRCESHHSLLSVPSKPGVFAIAEEVSTSHITAAASAVPRALSEAKGGGLGIDTPEPRRMLAVTQFFEDDDMAFVLDRMLSHHNPMRARLSSGRFFVRFVVIENQTQRRSICSALNQWIANSAEKATGIGSHFATSLELTENLSTTTAHVTSAHVATGASPVPPKRSEAAPSTTSNIASPSTTPQPDSGAATNIHCPFPSGF